MLPKHALYSAPSLPKETALAEEHRHGLLPPGRPLMRGIAPWTWALLICGDLAAGAIIVAGILFDAIVPAVAGAVILSSTTTLMFVFAARAAAAGNNGVG